MHYELRSPRYRARARAKGTICKREGNCFNFHELNATPFVSVSAVSIHVPGPLRDREPGNSVSKRAVSRRRSRQSYLKFIPRSSSDLHFNLGTAVNREGSVGKAKRGAACKLQTAHEFNPTSSYRHRAAATSASVPRLRTFLRGFDH